MLQPPLTRQAVERQPAAPPVWLVESDVASLTDHRRHWGLDISGRAC